MKNIFLMPSFLLFLCTILHHFELQKKILPFNLLLKFLKIQPRLSEAIAKSLLNRMLSIFSWLCTHQNYMQSVTLKNFPWGFCTNFIAAVDWLVYWLVDMFYIKMHMAYCHDHKIKAIRLAIDALFWPIYEVVLFVAKYPKCFTACSHLYQCAFVPIADRTVFF